MMPRLLRHAMKASAIPTTVCRAASLKGTVNADLVRNYPEEPRVAVGVVVFRPPSTAGNPPDLLLVRRAKEPSKGLWSFPGGSLELGETMAECAMREVLEETGIQLQNDPSKVLKEDVGFSADLAVPTAFSAVDSLFPDPANPQRLQYHYAIIEMAALVSPATASQEPRAQSDADAAMWLPVSQLDTLGKEFVPMGARITERALHFFPVASQARPR